MDFLECTIGSFRSPARCEQDGPSIHMTVKHPNHSTSALVTYSAKMELDDMAANPDVPIPGGMKCMSERRANDQLTKRRF